MNFEMIPPGELDKYVTDPDALIIDLRTHEEYMERHIKRAISIPFEQLQGCCMFPMDMWLILYCERGGTSLSAAKYLASKGYMVKSVVGGLAAYRGKMIEIY